MNTSMQTFREILIAWAQAEGHNTQAQAAEALGLNPQRYSTYIRDDNPSEPTFSRAMSILARIGGHPEWCVPGLTIDNIISKEQLPLLRALVAQKVGEPITTKAIRIMGTVHSSSGNVVTEDLGSIATFEHAFCREPGWEYGDGEIAFLRVQGSEMSPPYPDRCLIAVRAVRPGVRVPPHLDVLFRIGSTTMFRRLGYETKAGQEFMVAESYNIGYRPDHDAEYGRTRVFAADEATITHVVVGAIIRRS